MPTNDQIHAILTDLHAAQRALTTSSHDFDEAIARLGDVLAAIGAANKAQGDAFEAVTRATDKALAAFNGRSQ